MERVINFNAGPAGLPLPARERAKNELTDIGGSGMSIMEHSHRGKLYGTQWFHEPEVGKVPLIADMSSDFLWLKHDLSKYAMIYAGAQKNIGPSGVVVVVIRKDLVEAGRKDIPVIFRYETFAKNNS